MAAETVAHHKKEKLESKLKLDTKGCCFLCLTVMNLKTEVEMESGKDGDGNRRATPTAITERSSVSLRILNSYLNINLDKLRPKCSSSDDNKGSSSSSTVKPIEDPKVDLCKSCGKIIGTFSMLFLSLEKIQLELNYWQGRIHQQISNASKNPELVQNYSKRMTSDPETLTQLVLVDNLRKEISKMGLEKIKKGPQANVKLKRLDLKALKMNKSPVDSSSATSKIQTSSSALDQVVAPEPTTTEEPQIAHLLKFELQQEYDEEANLDQTPPNSPPPVLSFPTLSESCTSKKKRIMDEKAIKFQIKTASNSRAKKYVCTKCKKEFNSGPGARRHYDAIHLQRKWKCDICNNSTFAYPQDLRRHRKTCRNSLQNRLLAFKANQTDPRYKYICPNCGKRFKRRGEMLKHNRIVHLKEKNHACDLCDKAFLLSSHLNAHKNAVHLGVTFKCGACSKQFKYKHHLKEHNGKCKNKSGVC